MLCLAALIGFVAVFVRHESDLRTALARAAIAWGVVAILSVECLSLLTAIDPIALSSVWIIAAVALVSVAMRTPRTTPAWSATRLSLPALVWLIATILGLVLLTALIAEPNNWDSLTYHLPKVEQWLQNRSLAIYPTNDARQVALNPGAEILLLQVRALSGTDSLLNLVQFLAYVLCVSTASLVAQRLGADARGQVFAALFVATLPMAILQASSTQNDLVVACWIVLAIERTLAFQTAPRTTAALEVGAALGLALATKGTALIAALPIGIWLLVALRRHPPARSARYALIIASAVLLLNAGWWSRNYAVFQNPLGSIGPIVSNARHSGGVIVSNAVRGVTSEFLTPFTSVNVHLYGASIRVLHLLGLDPEDSATTVGTYALTLVPPALFRISHEDFAANPFHTVLAIGALVWIAWRGLRRANHAALNSLSAFCALWLGTALLYCLILRWQVWGARLQLFLYVLAAPFVGYVAQSQRLLRGLMISALVTVAFVPVLFNRTRPLLPGLPKAQVSLWSETRTEVLFANNPPVRGPYEAAMNALVAGRPTELGLLLKSGTGEFEYPIWYLLRRQGLVPRITHINTVVKVADPVRASVPDMILAVAIDPASSQDLAALQLSSGCSYEETGRWGAVVVLKRSCSRTRSSHQ